MEGLIKENDENAQTYLTSKKGLATAAAAAAVGNTRKRAALQTLTNINRPVKGEKFAAKINVYNEKDEKRENEGRIKRRVNATSSNVLANTRNTTRTLTSSSTTNPTTTTTSRKRISLRKKEVEEVYPNSDDTVEEEDNDDDNEDEDDHFYNNNDVMEDVEQLNIIDNKYNTRINTIEVEDDYVEVGTNAYDEDEEGEVEIDIADDYDTQYKNDSDDDNLLHDLTEPTALAVVNIMNDSVLNPNALFPTWNQADKEELRHAYYEIRNSPGILDDEDEDTYDISMVVEYGDDIFTYMRQLEVKMRPSPSYMDVQTEIQWSMRSVLVDWLVQVHHRFNLLPETLFLTINYMDRFLSVKVVSLSKFQLVGIVALFLAAKYEEINCPSVQEIVYMVENGYSADEILKAERYMIDLLDFNLGWPGPMSFLRRTSKADDYDLETRTLAKYLLEISVMDERFVGALPSWIAAAAHYLSRHMLTRGEWTSAHVYFSGYTAPQLKPAVEVLLECCERPLDHHKAIYEKYSDRKFKRASLFVNDYMQKRKTRREESIKK